MRAVAALTIALACTAAVVATVHTTKPHHGHGNGHAAKAKAAKPVWSMKTQNFAMLASAIDCDAPNNCMAPIVNDEGTDIMFSADGGNTWTNYAEPLEMMLLGGAIAGKTAACSGPFNVISGADHGNGWNFTIAPKGYIWVQSQNVEPFSGTCFGAVGGAELSTSNSWGVATSCDSGVTWAFHNASHVITCWTRYGAYPSKNTWYISSGNWPESAAERALRLSPDATHVSLSQRLRINRATKRAEYTYASLRTPEQVQAQAGSPYLAQILKTTDGGNTFFSQFEDSGHFYFNQIGCGTETHCCAVGEADTDSPQPGIQIWCTFDGSSWSKMYYGSDPTFSALSLQFLTDQHIFVGGASLRQQLIEGIFWESLDGGKSWNASFVKDAYPNEMTFGSETMGLATGFDLEGASCLLQYA